MRSVLKSIVAVSIFSAFPYGYGQQFNEIAPEAWIADVEYLESNVAQTFPDFESNPGAKEFHSELSQLKSGLASKSENEILFGIQKALGALGDDGCNIIPFQKAINTKILPVSIYAFEEGWFICDAKNKNLIGERLTRIDGMEIHEVFEKLKPYLNGDNEYYKQRLFAVYALVPELLRVAGVDGPKDKIAILLASGKTVSVDAEDLSEYSKLNRKLPNDGYFSLNRTDHKNKNYWLEYLPDGKKLFVQFQQISNSKEGPSFKKIVESIADGITSGKAQKIILDVRYGGGGNGFKLKPLTDLLRDSEQVNQDGNLIVLTSKATTGTLLELTSILRLNTKAVIIGEPTGEGPNTVGDVKYVQLPNSKVNISLTKIFWPTSWDFDGRTTQLPDVSVSFTFNDYKNGGDPWLKAAMDYKVETRKEALNGQLLESLADTYTINGRKVSIKQEEGRLWIQMNRKIKSFFEFNAELFPEEEGVLGTSISNVKIYYKTHENGDISPSKLEWKSKIIPIER